MRLHRMMCMGWRSEFLRVLVIALHVCSVDSSVSRGIGFYRRMCSKVEGVNDHATLFIAAFRKEQEGLL